MAAGTAAGRAAGRADAGGFSSSGITFYPDKLAELLESEQGPVAKDLLRRVLRVERAAKQACPVDTGRLRASITHRLERDSQGLYGLVGTNVNYAPHVEFGTKYMRAKPYLRPALNAALGAGGAGMVTTAETA